MSSSMPISSNNPTCPCDCCDSGAPPIVNSKKCGKKSSPVFVDSGTLDFDIPLLAAAAAGVGGFSFALNYWSGNASTTSMDGSAGTGFNYPQNIRLVPAGGGSEDVLLQLGSSIQERFVSLGGGKYSSADNNTSAVLTRSGEGSSADQFTLVSRDGVVSQFFGFDSSIAATGRIKQFTDRFGNTQSFTWSVVATGVVRLSSLTDSYGRTVTFTCYGAEANYALKQIEDFQGRKVNFQYDSLGHLTAVIGPSITRGADNDNNAFPNGTAYVFQYDVTNARTDRRNDLIAVYYPNQVAPYIDSTRTVNVSGVYASATPRQQIAYYNDPTDAFSYGKVQHLFESTAPGAGVGTGAYGYVYVDVGLPANLIDPSDPIVSRTVATDRNGNQTTYDINGRGMVVRKEAFATRGKNSLQATSWVTWTKYNSHNQVVLQVMPEGNSIANEYEDETNTITFGGVAYGRRIGLLKSVTRLPGNSIGIPSRSGSGPAGAEQEQLTQRYFHDPIFSQVFASIEERGNPINASGLYFPPQNLGATPTDADRSRYATLTFFDYQKDAAATVEADAALQAQLGLTSTEIGDLLAFVNSQLTATDGTGGIPAGFQMNLGDINGEGTGSGTLVNATHIGNVVKVQYPSVRQLIPNTGGGDPWAWADQARFELFTSNLLGQQTTRTDPEGNLTVYVRYPQNDPDGSQTFLVPTLSNKQYGFVKEVHVDADPATVMSLIGSDGDMVAFTGNIITRTNTPGIYQDLVTQYRPSTTGSGCVSCAYDSMGNPLSVTDPRGFTTTFERNELGEAFRTTTDAPYSQRVETFYDANRNVTRVDTEDRQVQYDSDDITDPAYAKFTPTGSGSTANLPTKAGPGGNLRPGWFSNLFSFDLLDNKIEQDIDATGSTPANLVSTNAFDFNQNLVKVTKPNGNLVEYDYDERNLRIATRVGYDPASGHPGSITVTSFDGNGNPIDMVGPAQRGTTAQSLSVVIDDAFRSGSALTHVGDWVVQNTLDGFDRLTQSMDAVGGLTQNTFEPGGRVIAGQTLGTAGGATPADRSGSSNVPLASNEARFDEAGRAYEQQRFVFLNTGISGGSPTHALPSGRAATHIGGGLAANSTLNNNHTTAWLLTVGATTYALGRTVFDRAGRVIITAADNASLTTAAFDGANRQTSVTDALGNVVQNQFDANGNVILSTRIEKCTISDAITPESFATAFAYDLLNRMIVRMDQGADGSLTTTWATSSSTIVTYTAFDSRGNRTNLVDPKQNTTVWEFDGASRQLREKRHLRPSGDGTTAVEDTVLTQTAFDANSNTIRLVDDNGGTTTWSYDSQDRQSVMTFHDGSTRSYVYNPASDVTGYTDENGSVFANSFDVLGRKTAVAITPAAEVVGTTSQSFQFDGLSRMTFSRDTVGSTNADAGFSFDSISRVLEEQQTYSGDTRYVTHQAWNSYTPAGFTYPNGRQVNTVFDALYRKAAISEASDESNIATWQFFGGRTATVTLGNGIVTSYMNDAQTRSAIQQGQATPAWGDVTTDHLGYDGSGRLIGKRHIINAGSTIDTYQWLDDPRKYQKVLDAQFQDPKGTRRGARVPCYDKCPPCSYKVAAYTYFNPGLLLGLEHPIDFHWSVEDPSGKWFGKAGQDPAHFENGPQGQCKTLIGCWCICGAAPSSAGLK